MAVAVVGAVLTQHIVAMEEVVLGDYYGSSRLSLVLAPMLPP